MAVSVTVIIQRGRIGVYAVGNLQAQSNGIGYPNETPVGIIVHPARAGDTRFIRGNGDVKGT